MLCNLYMECSLSALEETELEYLLQQDYDSELIRETRAVMRASRGAAASAAGHRRKHLKPRRLAALTGIAASVAAILTAGLLLFPPHHQPEVEYTAYVNGRMLTGDAAKEIVEAQIEKSRRFESRMEQLREQQISRFKTFQQNS